MRNMSMSNCDKCTLKNHMGSFIKVINKFLID